MHITKITLEKNNPVLYIVLKNNKILIQVSAKIS